MHSVPGSFLPGNAGAVLRRWKARPALVAGRAPLWSGLGGWSDPDDGVAGGYTAALPCGVQLVFYCPGDLTLRSLSDSAGTSGAR